jgi:hypothetical protein
MNENVVLAPEATATPAPAVATPAPVSVVKLSWAGLIGGIVVAVGVWVLLTVLGLAVGLSSFDPSGTMPSAKTLGIGTGIWSIAVSMIALFVGGLVGARTSGILDRPTGALHGAVLWSLATILSIALIGGVVRNVVRGAVSSAGMAVESGAQGGAMSQGVGIDATELIGPLNQRLRAEGKPTMTPAQLQAILQSATGAAMHDGRLDKEAFITSVTENTSLSRSDASDLADRVEAQLQAQAQEMKTGAAKVADAVGKAMWWVFLGMILGLASAILGATLGVSRRQRLAAGGVERPALPAAPPLATTREVHP